MEILLLHWCSFLLKFHNSLNADFVHLFLGLYEEPPVEVARLSFLLQQSTGRDILCHLIRTGHIAGLKFQDVYASQIVADALNVNATVQSGDFLFGSRAEGSTLLGAVWHQEEKAEDLGTTVRASGCRSPAPACSLRERERTNPVLQPAKIYTGCLQPTSTSGWPQLPEHVTVRWAPVLPGPLWFVAM